MQLQIIFLGKNECEMMTKAYEVQIVSRTQRYKEKNEPPLP